MKVTGKELNDKPGVNFEKYLVVIPAYNEEETVGVVVEEVIREGLQVLVVDDGSRDSTTQVALAAGASVVTLPFNMGVGGGLRTGFRWAVRNGFQGVVQCDADGQHPASEIRRMIEVAEKSQVDLLIANRFGTSGGYRSNWFRRIPMRFMSVAASRSTGIPIDDASSGFRVIRAELLWQFSSNFPTHYLGDTFEVLISTGKAGFKVGQTNVTMSERKGGQASSGTLASIGFLLRVVFIFGLGSMTKFTPVKEFQR